MFGFLFGYHWKRLVLVKTTRLFPLASAELLKPIVSSRNFHKEPVCLVYICLCPFLRANFKGQPTGNCHMGLGGSKGSGAVLRRRGRSGGFGGGATP